MSFRFWRRVKIAPGVDLEPGDTGEPDTGEKFFLVHDYLSVNAMTRPMQVREDEAEYGKRDQ